MTTKWSYSRINNALRCTLQYSLQYQRRASRIRVQDGAGRVGSAIHWILEKRLLGDDRPIDEMFHEASLRFDLTQVEVIDMLDFQGNIEAFMERYETWASRLTIEKQEIEHRIGITDAFEPCGYKEKNVWFRGILDLYAVVEHNGKRIAVITDHKTGRPAQVDKYEQQFSAYALQAFVNDDVEQVRCQIHYVKSGDIVTRPEAFIKERDFPILKDWLSDMIRRAEEASQLARKDPQPTDGWWCSYCAYKHHCPLYNDALKGQHS